MTTYTNAKSGKSYTFSPEDFSAEINAQLWAHGLGQKLGDSVAGIVLSDFTNKKGERVIAKETWGDFETAPEAADAAILAVVAALRSGEWTRTGGGGGPRIPEPFRTQRQVMVDWLKASGMSDADAQKRFAKRPTDTYWEVARVVYVRQQMAKDPKFDPALVTEAHAKAFLAKAVAPEAETRIAEEKAKNARIAATAIDLDALLADVDAPVGQADAQEIEKELDRRIDNPTE